MSEKNQFSRTFALDVALFIASILTPMTVFSATYVVEGGNTLATIATQIKNSPLGGIHHVKFRTFANVGAFNLDGLTTDSLVFEWEGPGPEGLEFTGTLFRFENVQAKVIFRNLAFKPQATSTILINGLSASANKNLLLDSCIFFGEAINTTFLSWQGSGRVQG